MDVRALYEAFGVHFDGVLALLRKEERIKLYLVQTVEDPAFDELADAVERGDWEAAFRAAHTVKGMSMNLMLDPLTDPAVDLVECLRDGLAPGREGEAMRLYEALKVQYDRLASLTGELS